MDLGNMSLLAATTIGFAHAFEADHLIAVSSIVTKRNNFAQAARDGVYWGLGHTSTIFLIGIIMILGRVFIAEETFQYLEAVVGFMLIGLGAWRLTKLATHQHGGSSHTHSHSVSYGVGLIHGLAGSGILVLAIMSTMDTAASGLVFLLVFGIGSTIGMLVASGLFSIPFWKDKSWSKYFTRPLAILSGLLCIGLGVFIVYENLIQ